MDRRGFLHVCGAGAAAWAIPRWGLGADAGAPKPNIVLIMADDLGYECLGCNGGTSYRTPHLDRLAAGGTRFAHAYCTPLCSPTRNLLMTGRYNFRNYRGWGILDPKEVTFGHLLRGAGYATCVSGKWQLCRFDQPENADHPRTAGFDESCVWTWRFKGKKPSRYWSPSIWQNGSLREGLDGKYGPDIHCDFVLDFIERHRSKPFFAYYPMNLVHAPFLRTPHSKEGGRGAGSKGGGYFADMVAYADHCVGRVVATLERLGLRERTLVLFTGDNGTPRGVRSKMGETDVPGGKGKMTDTGCHVPFIASWPGAVAAARTCEDLLDFSDVFPTLAELAGAPLPKDVMIDGRSFAPQLRGEAGTPRDWVYIQLDKKRAVRDRRWKLHADGRFFDMAADPFEHKPIQPDAATEEAAAARTRLQAVLASLH